MSLHPRYNTNNPNEPRKQTNKQNKDKPRKTMKKQTKKRASKQAREEPTKTGPETTHGRLNDWPTDLTDSHHADKP